MSRHGHYTWVIGILGLHLLMAVIVARHMSTTYDEPDHLDYGRQLLLYGNPERTRSDFDSKMPVSVLNALPSGLAQFLRHWGWMPRMGARLQSIGAARLPTIAASLVLAYVVGQWSAELYGEWAGRFALLLYAFSPNILAHATLATTDLYAALGAVLSSYYFARFLKHRHLRTALLAALILGLAQLAKFSSPSLFLWQWLLVVVLYAARRRWHIRVPERRLLVMYGLLSLVLTWGVLQIGFLFHQPIVRLANLHLVSNEFQALQAVSVLSELPLPVPGPFVQGLDMMREHERTGETGGNLYLLGEVRETGRRGFKPFYSYYVVCYLFKEPIALQLLFVMGLWWMLRHRSLRDFLVGDACVVFPMLGYVLLMTFTNKLQVGLRWILPSLAFTPIAASAYFAGWQAWGRRRQILSCLVLVYLMVSVLSYFPHMIPYTNELVLDRKLTYKIFADSNLSWGQNSAMVLQFIEAHPDVSLNPPAPREGRVLVEVNRLVGVFGTSDRYRWLREHYKPIAHVGYAHLLFAVGP